MNITFDNGKMIVNHPSGHVDEYSQADIEAWRDEKQEQLVALNNELVDMETKISDIQKS